MNKPDEKKINLTEAELNDIYGWVDLFTLSRPKKNIARDFSDGLLIAEIIKKNYNKLVELHNYPATTSQNQKRVNWATLNRKVFNRMKFQIYKNDIDDIINQKPYAIEKFLVILQVKIDKYSLHYRDDTTVHLDQLTGYTSNSNKNYSQMGGHSQINNSAFSNVNMPMETNDYMVNQNNYNSNDYSHSMGYNIQQMPEPSKSTNLKRIPNPESNQAPTHTNSRRKKNNALQMAGRNNLKTHAYHNSNTKEENSSFINTNNTKVYRSGGQIGKINYNSQAPNAYANDFNYTQSTNKSKINNPSQQKYKGKNSKEQETILVERDNVIIGLKDTCEILELKIKKMEQLLALKDGKVNSLLKKMNM